MCEYHQSVEKMNSFETLTSLTAEERCVYFHDLNNMAITSTVKYMKNKVMKFFIPMYFLSGSFLHGKLEVPILLKYIDFCEYLAANNLYIVDGQESLLKKLHEIQLEFRRFICYNTLPQLGQHWITHLSTSDNAHFKDLLDKYELEFYPQKKIINTSEVNREANSNYTELILENNSSIGRSSNCSNEKTHAIILRKEVIFHATFERQTCDDNCNQPRLLDETNMTLHKSVSSVCFNITFLNLFQREEEYPLNLFQRKRYPIEKIGEKILANSAVPDLSLCVNYNGALHDLLKTLRNLQSTSQNEIRGIHLTFHGLAKPYQPHHWENAER